MTPTNDAPVTVEQINRVERFAKSPATTVEEHDDIMAVIDFARHRLAALASAPAGKLNRDFTARRIKELMDEGDGFWRACSGCQEGEDGYVSEKDYPFDPLFGCQPGGGCSECGGIGVLWDDGRGYDDITGDEEPAPAPAGDGVRDDCRVVPILPTQEMLDAGGGMIPGTESDPTAAGIVWTFMLAAAPAALARPRAAVGERDKPKSEPQAWGDIECSGCTLPRRDCECN